MYILIAGDRSLELAEKLKSFWVKRNTTVYLYDYMTPIRLMHDASFSALGFFEIEKPSEPDEDLLWRLHTWGERRDQAFWGKLAKKKIEEVTARWDSLGLSYFSIIPNIKTYEDLGVFPCSYVVHAGSDEWDRDFDFEVEKDLDLNEAAALIAADIAVKMKAPFFKKEP